jgi:hypothetical protein
MARRFKYLNLNDFLGPWAPDPIHVSLVLSLESVPSSQRRRPYSRFAAWHDDELVHNEK